MYSVPGRAAVAKRMLFLSNNLASGSNVVKIDLDIELYTIKYTVHNYKLCHTQRLQDSSVQNYERLNVLQNNFH